MGSYLEVIVASIEDCIEAEAGGADRLELLSVPECGGLTPPIDLVTEVLRTVHIPVRVMLRDQASMSVDSLADLERLCDTARGLSRLQIDGLVAGFIRNGRVDKAALERICSAVGPGTPLTFHRAFDAVEDRNQAIRCLKTFPNVDRILMRGCGETLDERLASAMRCQDAASPQIRIVFAAGKDAAELAVPPSASSQLEYHTGRAARENGRSNGPVSRAKVAHLKQILG